MTMGERGLSPAELLAALVDGPLTEGDVQMIMELRVGLLAEGISERARVVECDVPKPLDPERTEWLHRLARQRLRGRLGLELSAPDDTSTEDR